ncbi:MAG: FAD-binding oxidoreductase [Chloroflexi bacterium]|nr:FAD-binding oxidoreductase [Chloroflexota bacterium]
MTETTDFLVIGGGCTGTSTAMHLARRKAGRVMLVEKHGIAMGATGKSSAIVRTHYTHEAPARMALAALRIFERFGEIVGGESGFRRTGFLALIGPRDVDAIRSNVEMHRSLGINAEVLLPETIRKLEPRINVEGVGAAAWEPESGYADPHGTAVAFSEAARAAGATIQIGPTVRRLIHSGGRVRGVETDRGTIEAGLTIVAAGFRAKELLAPLGFDAPIKPVRHNMAIVQRAAAFGAPHPIVSDRVSGSYYRPEGSELTLVGTTAADEGHVDPEVEAERAADRSELLMMAERFHHRFHDMGDATLNGGFTGVYDCTPDLQPMLGPLPGIDGLIVAAGFSGHGFKLSPVIGQMLCEQALDGRASLVDINLFSPMRFVAGKLIGAHAAYTVQTLG